MKSTAIIVAATIIAAIIVVVLTLRVHQEENYELEDTVFEPYDLSFEFQSGLAPNESLLGSDRLLFVEGEIPVCRICGKRHEPKMILEGSDHEILSEMLLQLLEASQQALPLEGLDDQDGRAPILEATFLIEISPMELLPLEIAPSGDTLKNVN